MGIITNIATRIAASAGSVLTRLRFNSWTMGGHGAGVFEKSAEALELERINPLRGVDEWRLGQIFDDARDGIYADLAWLYNEIEGVEPALVACCEMREGAAGECGWLVKTVDASRARGFDANLADEQRVALLEEFGAVEDDLSDVAEHLVSAFFRGAAHALPLWNQDGSLAGFRRLDLWNMAFDRQTGIWYWNADASRDEQTFQAIPPGEIVSLAVSSSRHVDHAALPIFIRAALGEKRYGVWLDRFGIPPVAVIMPPNAERGEQPSYMDLARKFSRGGNGILPNGSQVTYGTEARAVCPFLDFIRFQQQQIYTVGIGRVQSGDNQGANLGGNAAGVVEDGFMRIVRRDARRIARAINDCVTRKVLARRFPGRPALAQFAWDTEVKRTSREVLEDAGLAKTAGLAIDLDQVQELTGYKLVQATVSGPEGSGMSLDQLSSLIYPLKAAGYTIQKQQLEKATQLKLDQVQPEVPPPPGGLNAKTALQTNEKPLQNAPSDPDGQVDPKAEGALVEALSGLFEQSLAEAAADAISGGEAKNVRDINGMTHDVLGRFGDDGGGGGSAAKKDSPTKPAADKADATGDSGSSGASAEAATQTATSHARSEMLSGKLRKISPSEAHVLLSEPVTVKNPTGAEFRFTKEKLLADDSHLKQDHSNADFHRREKVMLYAIDAAKTSRDITNTRASQPNELGVYPQRKEVRKKYTDPDSQKPFEVVVRADNNGEVYEAFDVFPR